jgi:hypothetical protein
MGPNGIICGCPFLPPIRTLLESMIFSQLNPQRPDEEGRRPALCEVSYSWRGAKRARIAPLGGATIAGPCLFCRIYTVPAMKCARAN